MVSDFNATVYPGYGGKNDIRLSLREYLEFSDSIKQSDLSNLALMKFKRLYTCNMYSFIGMLGLSTVPTYYISRFLMGRVRRGSADLKIMFPTFCSLYFVVLWHSTSLKISRRLYTELLTDESDDGTNIRRTLKEERPNLWKVISSQINRLGYSFPEMPQANTSEIPQTLD